MVTAHEGDLGTGSGVGNLTLLLETTQIKELIHWGDNGC